MRWLLARIECWFDGHWFEHVRNVYGDEINLWDGARSLWQCQHCGARQKRGWLFYPLEKQENEDHRLQDH